MFVVASTRDRPSNRLCLTATSAAALEEEDSGYNTDYMHNDNSNNKNSNYQYNQNGNNDESNNYPNSYNNIKNRNSNDHPSYHQPNNNGESNGGYNGGNNQPYNSGNTNNMNNPSYDTGEFYNDGLFSDYNANLHHNSQQQQEQHGNEGARLRGNRLQDQFNRLAHIGHNHTLVVTAHAHSCPRHHVPPSTFLSVNLTTKS